MRYSRIKLELPRHRPQQAELGRSVAMVLHGTPPKVTSDVAQVTTPLPTAPPTCSKLCLAGTWPDPLVTSKFWPDLHVV